MPLPTTENLHPDAHGLDARPLADSGELLLEAQASALTAVKSAVQDIASAAELMAEAMRNEGRLIYVAAGSSGLMALADAAELGGTFGIPKEQIRFHMAGGVPVDAQMPGDTEDDTENATKAAADIRQNDVVIALSASGTTPYPLAFIAAARPLGAKVIAIANNPDTALLKVADIPILLATPPELISGSTRLGAATAQKVALNTMSTLMGVALGHVHDGMMVNLVADNLKLRGRAAGIVAQIAETSLENASEALERSNGAVKPAVLLAAGCADLATAETRLLAAQGRLRDALSEPETQ